MEAGWGLGNTRDMQDRHQSRALLCRCLGRRLGHAIQTTPRFPPRPFRDEKGSGMELPGASKLSLDGQQPRRPGERSCWRAPRTGKDKCRGCDSGGYAASLQAWRGFWAEAHSDPSFPRMCSQACTHNFQDASRAASQAPSAPAGEEAGAVGLGCFLQRQLLTRRLRPR